MNSPSSRRRNKGEPSVRTVSVFLSSLDAHIAQSYSRLRGQGSPHPPQTKEDSLFQDHCSTFDNASKLMWTSDKKEPCEVESLRESMCESSPAQLLDNWEVSQYIRFVYDTYGIPDPLAGTAVSQYSSSRGEGRNGQKISIGGSALSRPRSALSCLAGPSPFQSNRKPSGGADVSLIGPRPNSRKAKVVKLRPPQSRPPHQSSQVGSSRSSSQAEWVRQSFRYCFGCEAPILEANLTSHEHQCPHFRRLLSSPLEQILGELDEKLSRLSRTAREQFLEGTEEQFLDDYRRLKGALAQCLERGVQGSREAGLGCRGLLQESRGWAGKMAAGLQTLSKLDWFVRLRGHLGAWQV